MGVTNWKCTKCGNSTVSTNKPLVSGCPRGGSHTWTRVAAPGGVATWRCGKCGNTIANGGTRPMDRPCGRGGKCSWSRQR
jgi:predicted  nucleic acid-binding Zn-ribbon protein